MSPVCRSRHVRRIEELRSLEGVADRVVAVADAYDLVLSVEVRDLVYITRSLGLAEHLHDLLVCGVAGILVSLYEVLCHVAYRDAPVILDLAAAFASDALLSSAGAHVKAVFVVFAEPVRELLIRDGCALPFDGLFDRDDVHSESAAAFRHHVRDLAYRHHRSIVEECSDLRMLLHEFAGHEHVLSGTYYPLWNKELPLAVLRLTVEFQQTLLADAKRHLLSLRRSHIVPLGHLLNCQLDSSFLFEAEHESDLIGSKQFVEQPEIRLIVCDLLRMTGHAQIISDHRGELSYELRALLIRHRIGLRQIIPVIEEIVFESFRYHILLPLSHTQ